MEILAGPDKARSPEYNPGVLIQPSYPRIVYQLSVPRAASNCCYSLPSQDSHSLWARKVSGERRGHAGHGPHGSCSLWSGTGTQLGYLFSRDFCLPLSYLAPPVPLLPILVPQGSYYSQVSCGVLLQLTLRKPFSRR